MLILFGLINLAIIIYFIYDGVEAIKYIIGEEKKLKEKKLLKQQELKQQEQDTP